MPDADKKDSLDLDFDDIAAPTTKKTLSKKVKAPKAKPKAKKKRPEFLITIPTDRPRAYMSRDVGECTGQEFLAWATGVYPMITREATDFDDVASRMRALNQILKYHQGSQNWQKSIELENKKIYN